jgi:hypothetical protein
MTGAFSMASSMPTGSGGLKDVRDWRWTGTKTRA